MSQLSLSPIQRRAGLLALVLAGLAVALAPVVLAAVLDKTATRTVLAEAPARGAPGRVLALSSVFVPGGVTLAKHRHAGTQVATILAGKLNYHVFTGGVDVYRTGPDGTPLLSRRVGPGKTTVLAVGDTVVEQPGSIHQGQNKGTATVHIVLSSLFPRGAPSAIPVP